MTKLKIGRIKQGGEAGGERQAVCAASLDCPHIQPDAASGVITAIS